MTGWRIRAGILAVAATLCAETLHAGQGVFQYLATPVNVTPSSAGWQDVPVSSYIPVGATGVILQYYNNSGTNMDYGVRKNGSGDGFFLDSSKGDQQGWLMTGVDSNRIFEVYTEFTATVETWLVGYTMSGVTFLDNRVDMSLGSINTWLPLNISSYTATPAIGAIFTVHNTLGSSRSYGLRKFGSGDNRVNILRANTATLGIIGVDASERAEMRIDDLVVDIYLVGYVTSGAVFFTNGVDKSENTFINQYRDVDITANIGTDDANGAIVEVYPAGGARRRVALRPNPPLSSFDKYNFVDHSFAVVGIDSGDVFEQEIENFGMDLYLIGYTLATTTAVDLVSFNAKPLDGAVELTWETGSEVGNLAFHLYRSSSEKGPYERLTANPNPGLGSSPQGASYSYVDSGLTNGETYYYKLEDIETTGATELHGPVSATPEAGASPAIVDPAEQEGSESSRITYGSPWENEVRFHRNGRKGGVLELITRGFYGYPEEDGTVRLEVPGLELVAEPGEPWVPVYRGWLDAVAGRKVTLGAIRAEDVQEFTGLRPSAAEAPIVIASSDGTVQAGVKKVKRAFLYQDGLYPEEPARLADLAFQEGEKKALLELAPLRWDELGGRLLMAGRLQVRVSFQGRDPSEKVLPSGGGRHHVENHARRNVLAQLVTEEAGLYGVRFEDVFGSGGKSRKTNELRLSRQGKAVAFRVVPGSRSFERGSTLYFIGEGADANPYGDEAVYELEASRSGIQMERVNGAPSGSAVSHYWKTVRREENRLYQAAYIEAEDVWQWDWIFGPMTKSFPFQVTNLSSVSEPAQLDIWLQGASDFPVDPDHHARVYVNGTLVAERWWDGELGVHLTAELVAGVLHEGDNVLQVQEVGDTNALYSMIMLDRFDVRYPSELVVQGGELKGSIDQWGTARVSNVERGFVFDLTAEQPSWLDRVNHAEGLGFGTVEGHQYLVVGEDAVRSPEVRKPLQTSLRSEANAAEYLVVGPRAFLSAAEPLLRYRMNEGLRTKAVAVEDVLAEFGYGEATPDAIHDFLSYAYHHWTEPSLRYVLLLGDATYDPKNYLGTGVRNHVPVKLVKTRYMWTASDPWLAAVNGEDILPDVAIGRLPAASVDEVEALVEKILVYETGESDPEAPIVLVTDNPDLAGDFNWNADVLAATVLSGQNVEKIYLSELGTTATRSAIRNAFDEGASVMSYIGHGAIHMWANENLLNVGNVGSLSPQTEQPILFTMNCLNGYFHFPYQNSLAEALLKAEGKGIIAAFSPSGLSLDEPAHRFHRALLDEVVNQNHSRLGDAILAGQSDYADSGAFPELLSIYHLLGDPALKLK